MQFHEKKIDLFDFMSFYAWTFLNFLAHWTDNASQLFSEQALHSTLYRLSKLYRFLQTCVFLLVKLKISDIVYSTSLFISSLALPTTLFPMRVCLLFCCGSSHRATVSHFSLYVGRAPYFKRDVVKLAGSLLR